MPFENENADLVYDGHHIKHGEGTIDVQWEKVRRVDVKTYTCKVYYYYAQQHLSSDLLGNIKPDLDQATYRAIELGLILDVLDIAQHEFSQIIRREKNYLCALHNNHLTETIGGF